MNRAPSVIVACFAALAGCAPGPAPSSATPPRERGLADVARIHGRAGPWAVAGYRMGERALRALGLERGSFDLEVVHRSPREVQYACIADGASAATGASLGKLNLALEPASPSDTRTTYRRKSTGMAITLRLTASFIERFKDVPVSKLEEAGRQVMSLTDEAIFEVTEEPPAT